MLRAARAEEWPTIEFWRRQHFARLGTKREVIGQRGFDEACWLVIDRDGVPIAACSFTDDFENKRRWIHDLYTADGIRGVMAGVALGEILERMADDQGYELRASTDPENVRYLRYILRRGYELTAVEYRRVPRVRSEDSQSLASNDEPGFCLREAHGS